MTAKVVCLCCDRGLLAVNRLHELCYDSGLLAVERLHQLCECCIRSIVYAFCHVEQSF